MNINIKTPCICLTVLVHIFVFIALGHHFIKLISKSFPPLFYGYLPLNIGGKSNYLPLFNKTSRTLFTAVKQKNGIKCANIKISGKTQIVIRRYENR